MTETLTKEQIFDAVDSDIELVNVSEWDGYVYVRIMSGAARDLWEQRIYARQDDDGEVSFSNNRAELLVQTLCDADGEPIFEIGDIEALSRKSSVPLDRLCDIARRLNALRPEDIEEAAKNSEADRNENSIST